MKFAIVDGARREAVRGLAGTCPVCEVHVRPRCGRFRAAHWTHPPGSVDHHWEPETSWHRDWKALFPEERQEVPHRAENGERHIADVKTAHGMVLEFQNSPISEEERASREAIYRPMMCWVVNGLRLTRERRAFFEALRLARALRANPLTLAVPTENCLLLRKWENSRTLVLFDFGESGEESDPVRFGAPVLWGLHPGSPTGQAALMPIFRARFVDAVIKGDPLIGINCGQNAAPAVRVPRLAVSLPPPRPWNPGPPKRTRYGAGKRRTWPGSGTAPRGGWRM